MKKFRRTSAAIPEALPLAKPKSKKIWAIMVILVMAMSVIGFLTIDLSSLESYNGFKLVNVDSRSWKVVKVPDVLFLSHPADVASLPVSEEFMVVLKSAPLLYVTSDQADRNNATITAAVYDLVWPLAQEDRVLRFGASGAPGTPTGSSNLPGISCANATASVPVLELKTALNRSFEIPAPHCYRYTGVDARDFVDFRDRVLYGFYGVIPDDAFSSSSSVKP